MTKVTEAELTEINNLRLKLSSVIGEVGNFTLQIQLLQDDIKQLESKVEQQVLVFKNLIDEEKALIKRLFEKYGTDSINFETGEITIEK